MKDSASRLQKLREVANGVGRNVSSAARAGALIPKTRVVMFMRKMICILFLVFTACGIAKSQQGKLDPVFEENFMVLDSVTMGIKQQATLTNRQSAFLYLVAVWSGVETNFNHNREFPIDTANVRSWRSWYSRNSEKIDAVEFNKALELLTKFVTEGTFTEEDMAYWELLDRKYNKLK
jgi:hypothetical protein